jgi:hypothetical protein
MVPRPIRTILSQLGGPGPHRARRLALVVLAIALSISGYAVPASATVEHAEGYGQQATGGAGGALRTVTTFATGLQ